MGNVYFTGPLSCSVHVLIFLLQLTFCCLENEEEDQNVPRDNKKKSFKILPPQPITRIAPDSSVCSIEKCELVNPLATDFESNSSMQRFLTLSHKFHNFAKEITYTVHITHCTSCLSSTLLHLQIIVHNSSPIFPISQLSSFVSSCRCRFVTLFSFKLI